MLLQQQIDSKTSRWNVLFFLVQDSWNILIFYVNYFSAISDSNILLLLAWHIHHNPMQVQQPKEKTCEFQKGMKKEKKRQEKKGSIYKYDDFCMDHAVMTCNAMHNTSSLIHIKSSGDSRDLAIIVLIFCGVVN